MAIIQITLKPDLVNTFAPGAVLYAQDDYLIVKVDDKLFHFPVACIKEFSFRDEYSEKFLSCSIKKRDGFGAKRKDSRLLDLERDLPRDDNDIPF